MLEPVISTSGGQGVRESASVRETLARYAPLAPCVMGAAFARAGWVVSTSGSYLSTDDGLFTDGSALFSLVAFLLLGVFMYRTEFVFSKHAVNRFATSMFLLQFGILLYMGVMRLTGNCTPLPRFVLSIVLTFASLAAIAYWLRRVRGASATTAAVVVFSSLFVSEIPVFLTTLLPDGARCLSVAPLALAQIACMRWARGKPLARDMAGPTPSDDYFAFVHGAAATRRFLVACALGIGAMSLVIGFLRGFPSGYPIDFTPLTRLVLFVATEATCVAFAVSMVRQRSRTMTVGVWVLMGILGAAGLVLYAAFPTRLDVGAILVVLLSTVMSGFTWYIVIAFMSAGWRDPFYYAMGVWGLWIGARGVGRFVLTGLMPTCGETHFTGAVMSLLLLLSMQLILVKIIDVSRFAVRGSVHDVACNGERDGAGGFARRSVLAGAAGVGPSCVRAGVRADAASAAAAEPRGAEASSGDFARVAARGGSPEGSRRTCAAAGSPEEAGGLSAGAGSGVPFSALGDDEGYDHPKPSTLERLLGLDDHTGVYAVRNAAMRHSAERMGVQFMLSEREIEVLALYASGLTQKRVAEDLCISQTTVHTHIGRVYAKTGLHSRQEILDYMRHYADEDGRNA